MKKFFAVAVALLVMYGCSNAPELKPEEEATYNDINGMISAVKSDVQSAKEAGAEVYAAELFAEAQADLTTAENTLQLKDFPKSKEAAQKASATIKAVLSLPEDTQNAISNAEKQLNAAKDSKLDAESPEQFKKAEELINSAKVSFDDGKLKEANDNAKAAAEIIKNSVEAPVTSKNAVATLDAQMKLAKDLKLDEVSADIFKNDTAALDAAKVALEAKKYTEALDGATKASTEIGEEIKKAVKLTIEQAQSDLNAAKEAGAAEFATESLAKAEQNMGIANTLFTKGDYSNAKLTAENVSQISKEAAEKAKAGKAPAADATAAVTPEAAPATTEAAPATSETPAAEAPATSETPAAPAEAPAAVAEAPAAPAETPVAEAPKEEPKQEPKVEDNNKAAASTTPGETPAAPVETPKKSELPMIPIAIGVVVALVVIAFIVRGIRKKVTATETTA